MKIVKIKGTMITAERPGFAITRNQSFFKCVDANVNLEGEEECNDNDSVTQKEWKERDDREDQNYDDGIRDDELNGPIPVRYKVFQYLII